MDAFESLVGMLVRRQSYWVLLELKMRADGSDAIIVVPAQDRRDARKLSRH